MPTIRGRLAALLFLVAGFLLAGVRLADAQEEQFRFVFTPQVWLSNIPKNGFAAAASGGGSGLGGISFLNPFESLEDPDRRGPDPTSILFPQWGGQFAVQYRRWTFGIAGQYASFEHSTDLLSGNDQKIDLIAAGIPAHLFNIPFPCSGFPNANAVTGLVPPPCGTKLGTEVIRTDRIDIDLTATYFFPDVLPKLMDVNAGVGFKWIRASGQRTFNNNGACDPVLADCVAFNYIIKGHDFAAPGTPAGEFPTVRNKASFLDNTYAATFPTTLNFHLTSSGKWLLPFTVVPLVGWQERTDEVFGYSKSLAFGGTLDAGVRYVLDNGVAVYVGYRGQSIWGINQYLAHGPLFNMSVPLGSK